MCIYFIFSRMRIIIYWSNLGAIIERNDFWRKYFYDSLIEIIMEIILRELFYATSHITLIACPLCSLWNFPRWIYQWSNNDKISCGTLVIRYNCRNLMRLDVNISLNSRSLYTLAWTNNTLACLQNRINYRSRICNKYFNW